MIWLALFMASLGLGWAFGEGCWEVNLRLSRECSIQLALTGLLGVTLGALNRDRVRLRRTFASPTLAHLAKLVVFVSLAAGATFVLSPVGWDVSWLRAASGSAALGLASWIGNLLTRF